MSLLNRRLGEILDKTTPDILEDVGDWTFNSNIGIEIEVENFDWNTQPSLQNWSFTTDHSLRNNGCELISSIISGRKVYRALHDASEYFTANQPNASFNERCSVHVHVDITDLTVSELKNYVYLTVGIEPLLMKMVAPHRMNNNFCLQVSQASNVIDRLRNLFSSTTVSDFRDRLRRVSPEGFKYSATNFANMARLGTIEYRMHQGTIDKEILLHWVNVLCKIKSLSKQYVSVEDIRSSKVNKELYAVFQDGLTMLGHGDVSPESVESMLEESFEFANDILETTNVNMMNMLQGFIQEQPRMEEPFPDQEDSPSMQIFRSATQAISNPDTIARAMQSHTIAYGNGDMSDSQYAERIHILRSRYEQLTGRTS